MEEEQYNINGINTKEINTYQDANEMSRVIIPPYFAVGLYLQDAQIRFAGDKKFNKDDLDNPSDSITLYKYTHTTENGVGYIKLKEDMYHRIGKIVFNSAKRQLRETGPWCIDVIGQENLEELSGLALKLSEEFEIPVDCRLSCLKPDNGNYSLD